MSAPRSPWLSVAAQVRPEGRRLGSLAVALVIGTALPLMGPLLMRSFIDDAVAGGSTRHLLVLAAGYLAVAVSGQAVTVLATFMASGTAWRTTNRLREQVAEHALRLDMDFHARHTPGEMIERVDGDVLGLTEFMSGFVAQALGSGLLLAGTLVVVWAVDVRVGATLTALVAAGSYGLFRAQRRVVPVAAAFRQATADLLGAVEERLVAAEDIRANGAGPHVLNRLHEDSARVFGADRRWQRRGGAVLAGTNLLFALGTGAMLAVGILLLRSGSVTVGTVVLLLQYATLVRRPIEQIVGHAKQLHEAGAAATRVAELLAERPTIVDVRSPKPLPDRAPLSLRFIGVTFAYPGDPPVLHDIHIEVRAGRSLGLVGRTGSGKTTLARLALRLYDPSEGCVELAGIDLREVALASLRNRVHMVTQDVHLFGASVRDNLTLFDDGVDDTAVTEALREVGLGRWLAGLPEGLDTLLGQGNIGLSAGEAQLVAFARVLLAEPGLIVLDEPSSRLDAATESVVHAATDRLLTGRTAVVIAHRLATLATVDDVAVLEGGRLVEHGPRAELAEDGFSRFARLLAAAGATR